MPNFDAYTRLPCRNRVAALAVFLCLVGCATPPASTSRPSTLRADPEPATDVERAAFGQAAGAQTPPLIPVLRESRYTLVELAPAAGQQDLMQQIVEVTIPATLNATVGDALRFVLIRSGFQLCQSPDIRLLDRLPLPAADVNLGPLTLESALRILAGPGWNLKVDKLTRQVCFAPVSLTSPLGQHQGGGSTGEEPPNTKRAVQVGPELVP